MVTPVTDPLRWRVNSRSYYPNRNETKKKRKRQPRPSIKKHSTINHIATGGPKRNNPNPPVQSQPYNAYLYLFSKKKKKQKQKGEQARGQQQDTDKKLKPKNAGLLTKQNHRSLRVTREALMLPIETPTYKFYSRTRL